MKKFQAMKKFQQVGEDIKRAPLTSQKCFTHLKKEGTQTGVSMQGCLRHEISKPSQSAAAVAVAAGELIASRNSFSRTLSA